MTTFDRQKIIEDAAKAIFDVRDDEFDLDEWEDIYPTERERYQCDARAILPVIVAAVLKPIRELHREQFQFCRDCDADYPCPTIQLCDAIESSAKGGE